MPNMTLALDDELHEMLKRHPEVKWSVVAREAMRRYAEGLETLEATLLKSKATEADVEEIGRSIKRNVAQYYEGLARKAKEQRGPRR